MKSNMITDISIVGLEHRYKIIEKILWLLLLNYLVPDSTCTHLGRFVGQSDPFGCRISLLLLLTAIMKGPSPCNQQKL